ncbi:class F sortase [Streptomyces peucetius]|uniref:Class F sortase n=1 Tax=Streptomyces peucetius TaxID=1950 RepID=A0ABY6IEY7_STRPE|nr:class F sortase [Streptomyces peucetius]UYQ65578.1 class F sortase [Streptomyces peucetius]
MENGPRPRTTGEPASWLPSFKALACAAIAGILLLAVAVREDHPPQPSSAQARSSSALPAPHAAPVRTVVRPLPESDPVRLMIPAIGVNAPMTRLELDDTGALLPPPADEPGLAGWYGAGTAPGAVGTAVAAGHVDTPMGPGVFYRLGALTKGDTVEVVREDGRTAVFSVDAVEVHDKSDFPDDQVYGDSDRPELRVITCGGDYSSSTGYQGNVVVYATLSAVR